MNWIPFADLTPRIVATALQWLVRSDANGRMPHYSYQLLDHSHLRRNLGMNDMQDNGAECFPLATAATVELPPPAPSDRPLGMNWISLDDMTRRRLADSRLWLQRVRRDCVYDYRVCADRTIRSMLSEPLDGMGSLCHLAALPDAPQGLVVTAINHDAGAITLGDASGVARFAEGDGVEIVTSDGPNSKGTAHHFSQVIDRLGGPDEIVQLHAWRAHAGRDDVLLVCDADGIRQQAVMTRSGYAWFALLREDSPSQRPDWTMYADKYLDANWPPPPRFTKGETVTVPQCPVEGCELPVGCSLPTCTIDGKTTIHTHTLDLSAPDGYSWTVNDETAHKHPSFELIRKVGVKRMGSVEWSSYHVLWNAWSLRANLDRGLTDYREAMDTVQDALGLSDADGDVPADLAAIDTTAPDGYRWAFRPSSGDRYRGFDLRADDGGIAGCVWETLTGAFLWRGERPFPAHVSTGYREAMTAAEVGLGLVCRFTGEDIPPIDPEPIVCAECTRLRYTVTAFEAKDRRNTDLIAIYESRMEDDRRQERIVSVADMKPESCIVAGRGTSVRIFHHLDHGSLWRCGVDGRLWHSEDSAREDASTMLADGWVLYPYALPIKPASSADSAAKTQED